MELDVRIQYAVYQDIMLEVVELETTEKVQWVLVEQAVREVLLDLLVLRVLLVLRGPQGRPLLTTRLLRIRLHQRITIHLMDTCTRMCIHTLITLHTRITLCTHIITWITPIT